MSALGHKRTLATFCGMSALPPKADICSALARVRFGPKADIATSADSHAMTALHHGGKLECDTSRGECDTSRGERSCHRGSSGYLPWFACCARRHRHKQLRS